MNSQARTKLVDRLNADNSFKALSSNLSRADYVLSEVQSYDQFMQIITKAVDKVRTNTRKNLSMAMGFIAEAELHLSESNLNAALISIHKSLLYTPWEDNCKVTRAKLYVDKASIHFNQENYLAALWSIEMAHEMLSSDIVSIEYSLFRVRCFVQLGWNQEANKAIDHIVEQHTGILFERELAQADLQVIRKQLQKHFALGDGAGDDVDGDIHTNYATQNRQWKVLQHKKAFQELNKAASQNKIHFVHSLDPRISICHSPIVGRHFVATETIPDKEVVLRERPISVVMEGAYLGQKCSHCQHDLEYRFYPCANCTEVAYCDAQCARAAQTSNHQVECGIGEMLRLITSPVAHVFKMIAQIGGPEKALEIQTATGDYDIEQYLAETGQMCETTEDAVPESVCKKNIARYKMASSLANHDSKHDSYHNAYHTVLAIETAVLLDLVYDFSNACSEREFLLKLISMIVVDIRRIVYNMFGWHEYEIELDEEYIKSHVANGQCVIGSLANHSCLANVSWDWKNGVIWFTANRIIAVGEPITISYGTNKTMDYYDRQLRLNHYLFVCGCAACHVDATRGDCLRCRDCSGPVVFDSAANEEPCLDGLCLSCCNPYEQFDRFVRELNLVKDCVKKLASLVMIKPNEPKLFTKALHQLNRLQELSLDSSESIIESVFGCSSVIEHFPLDSLYSRRMDELIRLALMVDTALPKDIPSQLLNGPRIGSLRFWFESLQRWTKQMMMSTNQADLEMVDKLTEDEQLEWWNALKMFEYRYQEALLSLIPDDDLPGEPVHRIIHEKIDMIEQQTKQISHLFHN